MQMISTAASAIWTTLVEWFGSIFTAFCALVAMVKGVPLLYRAALRFIKGVDTLVNINDRLDEGNGRMLALEKSNGELSEHLARQDTQQAEGDKAKLKELSAIKKQLEDLRMKVDDMAGHGPPKIQT
jgi:ABC-type phosphate transport system auxiliary subunit